MIKKIIIDIEMDIILRYYKCNNQYSFNFKMTTKTCW